ncbi:MAG: AsmA family protein [Candidatus Devosia phytovorans]|uniref:AsmA family protein n=1 Tax=Candidatus Devosia phytovorans TaxID=3121372 RepID=A0AAJ5VXV1_9HYPH|nr:AsmA family protein [Devosia sp.]WEK05462.1 MAG: AsmA family protein [Devosia sp.]
MLNRIYIVVGLLAIIVLGGAFIAPHFIRWSDYRLRMEELATAMLGTPVTVRGDIQFTLLPQPRLHFDDVLVGSTEAPAATVDSVEADFSLMDFLRDNYNITRLVLSQPVIDFTVDESGLFGSGVSLETGNGGVGLSQATVVGATVRLIDERSGEQFSAENVSGEFRLSDFSGPISFVGSGDYRGASYSVRLNSSAVDGNGRARLTTFLQPQSAAFTLSTEGMLEPGMAPRFNGKLVYRQKPPASDVAGEIRGDLVFESEMTASSDRVVLSGYTLRPDENRAGTRLTGAASIQLGDERSFDAVISGGVFSLPPRDAQEETAGQPYELVRLLSELPAPTLPPMPGRIGVDLAEMGLRGFSLRNVRVDAVSDGAGWTVEQFAGQLPGDTSLQASGQLGVDGVHPTFRGDLSLTSTRLDGFAALWRKPDEDNVLFNVPASLAGRAILGGDALGLNNGVLTIEGQSHAVELRLGFGEEKRLDLVGHFDALSAADSEIVSALLPNATSDAAFGTSFPEGSFSLTAKSARVLGLDGTTLVAEGQWRAGQINLSRLSAADLGGVGFDTTLNASGTLAEPVLSGSGLLRVVGGSAPAMTRIYDLFDMPHPWRDFLARSAPADLMIDVSEPVEGAQTVTMGGALGFGELNLRAELDGGLRGFSTAPLRVTGGLESTDIAGLTQQIGFGNADLFDSEGSMLLSFGVEGVPSEGLTSSLTASLGEENIGFSGSLLAKDGGEIQGTGTLDARLADAGALARVVGVRGLSLPLASGSAQLHFEGDRLARLTEIAGTSGETGFSGELALSRTGTTTAVSGTIAVDMVSAEGLAVTLFGPAALVAGDGVWPEGPLATDSETRQTRGTVTVSAGGMAVGGAQRFGATSFELSWDETRMRLARFEANMDSGTLGLDIAVCCSGPLSDRTVSGRMTLTGMPIDTVMPPAVAEALGGVAEGGLRFEGTGASLADVLATASGEGNFTLTDFTADGLTPEVFTTIAGLEDVLDMEPDDMGTIMDMALGQGAFAAPSATGAFTIAGGVLRLANLIVEGEDAGLAGSLNLTLGSLGLGGSFALTPRNLVDDSGLVSPETARIIARVAGTLVAPQVTVDLEEMIAAVMVRANEIEVDRLEQLQAEDAERQRAAAEERNRLIAEQQRRAAEEAARLAAQEEAQRMLDLAAAAEQERVRLENLRQQQLQTPITVPPVQMLPPIDGPIELGLPANQFDGSTVNRPL